jgi:hypothetical protein
MNLRQKWMQHLKENNMTYVRHLVFALFYGTLCLLAGFYLIVHSVLPCFFPTAGSDLVTKLSKKFKTRR